jgi:predicted lipoprotein with Yx(FWY)xxD motif
VTRPWRTIDGPAERRAAGRVTNRGRARQTGMRTFVLIATSVAALVLAAAATAGSPSRTTVTVHASSYGRILFDGTGFALYAFTKDGRGPSSCSGACAAAWPPFVVPSRARAGAGVSGSLLGTVRRRGGRLQATYGGRPLYYYVGDRRPLQVLCQNVAEFGGTWLVLRANGSLVR